jgi:hypothetical protein
MRRDSFCFMLRAWSCAAILMACGSTGPALAQAVLQDVTLSPFVIGFRPVVGRNGAVGGVLIDARGVVARADADAQDRLQTAREKALEAVPADLDRASELRKVSLRGLEQAITELRLKKREVTDEIQNLAGLQRIRYVFVDQKRRDIVLAGPAEGWKVGPQGAIVGRKSGAPVLQLDDLVFALRTAEAARDEAISCSIDPTPEGVQRFTRWSRMLGPSADAATLHRVEEAVGPQRITIRGVPADSRFARVMVAADVLMKRLAMGFERSPIAGLPSYLELIQRGDAAPPREAMPRWWLAPKYDPLLHDPEGLAWELRGEGVRAMTEDTRFTATGAAKRTGKENPLAKRWADAFSDKYGELSAELPVFAELRNCIDLAVVAALIVKHELPAKARYGMPLLMSKDDVKPVGLETPKTIASQATAVRKGGTWVVAVSGGVEINSWGAADKAEAAPALAETRQAAAAKDARRWWWD